MSHIEEFWLGVHNLCTILEAREGDGSSPEVLDALHHQYLRLPQTTQQEVQRELSVMIAGLQRLENVILDVSERAAQHGAGKTARRARRH